MKLAMEKYLEVRKAQKQGARTLEEFKQISDIQIENEEEEEQIKKLLKNACRCKEVSIEEVLEAIRQGADSVEKIGEATKAGTECGRCKGILENILENGR